jgi:hypothetical protein
MPRSDPWVRLQAAQRQVNVFLRRNLAAALTSYQASHAISDRLAKADPGTAPGWPRLDHRIAGEVPSQADILIAMKLTDSQEKRTRSRCIWCSTRPICGRRSGRSRAGKSCSAITRIANGRHDRGSHAMPLVAETA